MAMPVTSAIGSLINSRDTHERRIARRMLVGFSLIELLVVVAIMLALAALFPVALDRMLPARRIAASAYEIATVIRDLESQAAARDEVIYVSARSNAVSVKRSSSADSKVTELASSVQVHLKLNAESQDDSQLIIYPDGSTTGARLQLVDGSHHAFVSISSLTGYVRVET